uniref:Calcyclin-binding protein n=2 Tax=Paramormyrops kingsleyae TaxID=1676925 RepID=A0A3B3QP14_9TELE|nr:calcyclin-binding protein [Paramormyrops kingsleyae]
MVLAADCLVTAGLFHTVKMDIGEQIIELESDLREIKCVIEKCERKRVRDVLAQEQKKIREEIAGKRQEAEKRAATPAAGMSGASNKAYTVKINNYGWDQSDNFVKIYITLKGVHKLAPENVETSFTERSFVLLVKDLDGKNHQMTINNLLCPINVTESCRKIKTDMVLVMCKKKTQKRWECLTQVEKQTKDKEKPSYDENADPGEGLMNMLKKIYSEGDDEMKRTISKAWTESQEKKLKGEVMDF